VITWPAHSSVDVTTLGGSHDQDIDSVIILLNYDQCTCVVNSCFIRISQFLVHKKHPGMCQSILGYIILYSGVYLWGPKMCELCKRLWGCIIYFRLFVCQVAEMEMPFTSNQIEQKYIDSWRSIKNRACSYADPSLRFVKIGSSQKLYICLAHYTHYLVTSWDV